MEPPLMVHLTSVSSRFEADVLSARLGAEGILWELRASGDLHGMSAIVGPGAWGTIDVLVEVAKADVARELLGIGEDHPERSTTGRRATPTAWVMAAIFVLPTVAGFVAILVELLSD